MRLPDKMLSMVLRAPNQIAAEEIPLLQPGPDEVLVAVRACAQCGSDLHAYKGLHARVNPPRVLGHEFAGEVAAVGPGVHGTEVGTRCCVENHIPCGRCEYCRAARPNLCVAAESIGFTRDGAYAQFVLAPEHCIIPLPDEVSYPVGAVMQTMGVAYHAVRDVAQVRLNERVAIQGAGPIGLCALAVAKAAGAYVVQLDAVDYRLDAAKKMGADAVVNVFREDPVSRMGDLSQGRGFDKVIEAVGGNQDVTLQQASQLVKRGGLIVAVGTFGENKATLRIVEFKDREMTLKGSRGHPRAFPHCIDLVRNGRVHLDPMLTHRIPLIEAEEGLRMMEEKRDEAIKVVLEPHGPADGSR